MEKLRLEINHNTKEIEKLKRQLTKIASSVNVTIASNNTDLAGVQAQIQAILKQVEELSYVVEGDKKVMAAYSTSARVASLDAYTEGGNTNEYIAVKASSDVKMGNMISYYMQLYMGLWSMPIMVPEGTTESCVLNFQVIKKAGTVSTPYGDLMNWETGWVASDKTINILGRHVEDELDTTQRHYVWHDNNIGNDPTNTTIIQLTIEVSAEDVTVKWKGSDGASATLWTLPHKTAKNRQFVLWYGPMYHEDADVVRADWGITRYYDEAQPMDYQIYNRKSGTWEDSTYSSVMQTEVVDWEMPTGYTLPIVSGASLTEISISDLWYVPTKDGDPEYDALPMVVFHFDPIHVMTSDSTQSTVLDTVPSFQTIYTSVEYAVIMQANITQRNVGSLLQSIIESVDGSYPVTTLLEMMVKNSAYSSSQIETLYKTAVRSDQLNISIGGGSGDVILDTTYLRDTALPSDKLSLAPLKYTATLTMNGNDMTWKFGTLPAPSNYADYVHSPTAVNVDPHDQSTDASTIYNGVQVSLIPPCTLR